MLCVARPPAAVGDLRAPLEERHDARHEDVLRQETGGGCTEALAAFRWWCPKTRTRSRCTPYIARAQRAVLFRYILPPATATRVEFEDCGKSCPRGTMTTQVAGLPGPDRGSALSTHAEMIVV